jgi:flavin reductase (DIM6/NTAB) family NADH-FMN oxidoreductase RutF
LPDSVLSSKPTSIDDLSESFVDVRLFLNVMRSVCSPVSIVTSMSGMRPHGTTVSAFSSLSLIPPMILVSLSTDSDLLKVTRKARRFGVNVLAVHQEALATRFAKKGQYKFDGVAWTADEGMPRLPNVAAWLNCDAVRFVQGGDHVVVFGNVLSSDSSGLAPLTYHQGHFGSYLDEYNGTD